MNYNSIKNYIITPQQFPGYKLENDTLNKIDGWSRTGILIRNNISYKRRHDLEYPGLATVWIQVGTPGTKHFLLQGAYRQFQRQGVKGSITPQKPASQMEEPN